ARDLRRAGGRSAATGGRDGRGVRRRRARSPRAGGDGRDTVTWTTADIGSQAGRTAPVTGVSPGGLGYFTALELARAGARVVLAGRSPDNVAHAEKSILEEVPTATLERLTVDLASLESVRAAAASYTEPLDVVVNNAGIMAPPYAASV